MTPKWTPERERVYRAAMKWAEKFSNDLDYSKSPFLWTEDHALRKACAAARRRKP